MRPDVVKFDHRQLSFIDEKFYHISLPKTIEIFSVLLNAAVMAILGPQSVYFPLKLVFEHLK